MQRIGQEEINAVARVIESKALFKGEETKHFQEEMQEKFDVKHVHLMSSGAGALTSALIAMGIGPGDEVIVPGYTYIASAMAVVAVGAIPVIAEIDESLTLCPIDVEKKITSRTKALLPVHIQGFPSNMDALCALAKKYNLYILEDACQADGGSYKGKRLGTIGDCGAYSFNQYKLITAGEGGALATNSDLFSERALIYHDSSAVSFFGQQLSGAVEPFCGTEFRTNEISAAIMREQLKKLDGILEDLRKNKKKIMDALKDDFKFAVSNDIEGDCSTVVPFQFDTVDEAIKFSEMAGGGRPINTGKHVYSNWAAILEKRGAVNPAFDPFKMEANRDHIPDYSPDMCPKTLDILSRTVYVSFTANTTDAEIDAKIQSCKKAKAAMQQG